MSVSRRRFLKASAVLSAALVLKPGSFVLGQNSLWSNSSPESNSAHTYRREAFEPYIGDVFRVRIGKQMVDLKLVALENVAPASRGAPGAWPVASPVAIARKARPEESWSREARALGAPTFASGRARRV